MSGNEKQSSEASSALSAQVQMLQKAIDDLKKQAGLEKASEDANAPQQQGAAPTLAQSQTELRLESLAKLVQELQKDNANLRGELKARDTEASSFSGPIGSPSPASRSSSGGRMVPSKSMVDPRMLPSSQASQPDPRMIPGHSMTTSLRSNQSDPRMVAGHPMISSLKSNKSTSSSGSQYSRSSALRSVAKSFRPRSDSPPRIGDVRISPNGTPTGSLKLTPSSQTSKNNSMKKKAGKLTQLPTVEVVKEAGGSDADLSFLKYHQDILDTFRPALRALISGLINYKFEHHDHVILPYYRTYVYGGEGYVLYHEAEKAEKNRNPLERVPFRRPLDMDIFVPIDVKDWSEPHRLQRKQELFIQDLWKIWGRQEVQMLAEMAMRSLNNRGFDLTGPYMSTAVSALFLKDPSMRGNMTGPNGMGLRFHPSQIDNDRMYRKVCLEYYDATADHMVTLCEFQLKPRISWGDFDEVYTMMLNNQDLTVQSMIRGPRIIKNKRAPLPPCIRVPSVKKVIRVACTGVSGNRAVQIREVDGVVQLHAPQERCRNPNPQGIPTVPILAVTDLSRRDWFLDTIVTPLMKTDPEVLQDVRQLSRQMQKEQNVFPELGMLDAALKAGAQAMPNLPFPPLPEGVGSIGSSYSNNDRDG